MRRLTIIFVALVLIAAACGGGDDSTFESGEIDTRDLAGPGTSGLDARASDNAEDQDEPGAPDRESEDVGSLVEQATSCLAEAGGTIDEQSMTDVLGCFDVIRSRQPPVDSGEGQALRRACEDDGGDACTELLLRSNDENDQLMGLACGGRSPEIPCPMGPIDGPAQTTTVVAEPEIDEQAVRDEYAGSLANATGASYREAACVADLLFDTLGISAVFELDLTDLAPTELELFDTAWAACLPATTTTAGSVTNTSNACGGYVLSGWGDDSYYVDLALEGSLDGFPACLYLRREPVCRDQLCSKDRMSFRLQSGALCLDGQIEMVGGDGGAPFSSGIASDLDTYHVDCGQGGGLGVWAYLRLDPGGQALFLYDYGDGSSEVTGYFG